MNIIKPNNESEYSNPQGLRQYQGSFKDGIGSILIEENSNILTDNEINIITQTLHDSGMQKHTIQIINELGKRICNGEIPSLTMLDNVVCNILYGNVKINAEMASVCISYIMQIQKIINKLPDRKNIASLFNERLPKISSNPHVIQFKKIKSQSFESQTPNQTPKNYHNNHEYFNTTKAKPSIIASKEISTENPIEHTKVKAEYEAISGKDYAKKFPEFQRTDNIETNVPLLSPEDIAFSTYNGGYECITQYKHTKVPSFDIRQNGGIEEFIKKNGKRNGVFSKLDGKGIIGKPYSFYNENDDISHIMIFCDNRGLNAAIHISIKGKVSQHDANDLIKYLKNKYSFEIDSFTGNIYKMREINRGNIQESIMNFFNSK